MPDGLDVPDLDHRFGELVVRDGVSSEVRTDEIVGFVGRPGRITLPRAQIRPPRDAGPAL